MYAEAHHWHTLDRFRSFEISRENSSLVIQSGSWIEQRWTCEDVYDIGENQAKIVVHAIEGWYVGPFRTIASSRTPEGCDLHKKLSDFCSLSLSYGNVEAAAAVRAQ